MPRPEEKHHTRPMPEPTGTLLLDMDMSRRWTPQDGPAVYGVSDRAFVANGLFVTV